MSIAFNTIRHINAPSIVRRARNGASMLTSRSPLTLDQVRQAAPSIFAETRHESRSERYSYIPTHQILAGLMREGFEVFTVAQGGSRIEGKRDYTKHTVRLRHVDTSRSLAVGDSFPEIILGNSHDGTSAYTLRAGVFRLACLNGMVVCQEQFADIRIPHKGDILGQVLDGCIEVMDHLPKVAGQIADWQGVALQPEERVAFARAALALRYEEQAPLQPEQVLTPRRAADTGSDLWSTLNRVQENMIRGGISYRATTPEGRPVRRTTREIGGIDQGTAINRGLWTLAAEMQKLKA